MSWDAVTGLLAPRPAVPVRPVKPGAESGVDGLVRFVAAQSEGNRNAALHWAACRAVDGGHDPMVLLPAALSVGLSEWEATGTIRSAARSGSVK